ncbi:MAG: RNA polymerase sporulation sigma factor SigK [Blautia sp.]|nr:RNA polymerase sporulation sigma factor SigK [Blautia sp.]MCM1282093.1 RNA polymerase sporulation sigma factor SigK [Roseburia sp.]MCM1431087.1 RNA polymerase sporulation sigma factor SigK [Muribaculaceae bacterium]MCM1493347.1 RNA polymerase sporulation sigma factor SigK [Muribaculaceae bacterium]
MKTFLAPLSRSEEAGCLQEIAKGNPAARDELILHNMRLVAHVAKKYQSSEEDMEDLISIGTIGLLKAVGSFKTDYGSRFATYAIRCIDNEMLMHFRSRKKTKGEVSLFEPIGTDKEGNQIHLVDVLEQEDADVAADIQQREQIAQIRRQMEAVLSPREYLIIRKRFGLDGEEECTQREISEYLRISRSYVSRIEKKALLKLRKILSE